MKIEIEIEDDKITSMLHSAGGWCQYWCATDRPMANAMQQDVAVFVHEEENQADAKHVLNRESLQKGLALCAKRAPWAFKALLEGMTDGPTSDVIVQYALLKKETFG